MLCVVSACCAQAIHAPGARSPSSQVHVSSKATQPARTRSTSGRKQPAGAMKKKAASPLLPFDAPARQAIVSLKNGKLTIEANNSDLTQILQKIADISGMTIDGLNKNTRVFGVYGPGNPSDILTKLLVGCDYNFMMVGKTEDGAPRQLLFLSQNNNAPALTPANQNPAALDDRNHSQLPASDTHQDDTTDVDAQERLQQTVRRLELRHEQMEQEQQDQQNAPQ
ncbi:MAG: hypothetical protein H0U76_27375 [Ktedonobacteraceae bacterium]|nr:hypothetical protein [Ktedonobacteraceae bacterium]